MFSQRAAPALPRRTKRHISQEIAEWDEANENPEDMDAPEVPDWGMLKNPKQGHHLA